MVPVHQRHDFCVQRSLQQAHARPHALEPGHEQVGHQRKGGETEQQEQAEKNRQHDLARGPRVLRRGAPDARPGEVPEQ
ncbi:hypothetical protein D3C83_126020 [compost metagenome]